MIEYSPTGGDATAFSHVIGLRRSQLGKLIDAIRRGLPAKAVERLQHEMHVTRGELAVALNVPQRTLARRIREGRLRSDESERVVRLARLFQRTIEVLGGKDEAIKWLKAPKRALGGKTPLEYADTEPGAEEVRDLLGRIEHGVFS